MATNLAAWPKIEAVVTFLTAEDGGRAPLSSLSGDTYRPHIVIGDPAQRHAVIADGNRLVEEYIGVSFHEGPALVEFGVELKVVMTLMYFPHPVYEGLQPGVTFTVREGAQIVAFGEVRRRLF